MGNDFDQGNISVENSHTVVEATRRIIVDLGNRFDKPRARIRRRIVGLCPPGEVHSLGLLMILEILRQDGAIAAFVGENKSALETREFVERYSPDLVCLTCSTAECVASAAALIRDLRAALPGLKVVAGGNAAVAATPELLTAGCLQVFGSVPEARRGIRGLTLGRLTSRSESDLQLSDAV